MAELGLGRRREQLRDRGDVEAGGFGDQRRELLGDFLGEGVGAHGPRRYTGLVGAQIRRVTPWG